MDIEIRKFEAADAEAAAGIWNEVVDEGTAFPQLEDLTPDAARSFFSAQTYTGVAVDKASGRVVGLYILHPNNVGRCGHIANASYAVAMSCRGQHVGEALVRDCLKKGRQLGFRILQFNAVVAGNTAALALYRKLGFIQLGTIPGGFLMKDGTYQDIILHYHIL